jgi:hypothetical protein
MVVSVEGIVPFGASLFHHKRRWRQYRTVQRPFRQTYANLLIAEQIRR